MDRISDGGKKVPLLVIGDLPAAPTGAVVLAPAGLSAPGAPDLNEFYVVLAVPAASLDESLSAMELRGLRPEQVIVYLPAEATLRHPSLARIGVLEQLDGESAEELRARLLGKVEAQRQKKLLNALREAHDGGLARRLGDAELGRVLDATRVAHALACGYGLAPSAHARALRACLEGGEALETWAGDPPPERLIPSAAAFLVDTLLRGASARDAIRERAAALSFRARTDLLHQVEHCLGTLLGGKHAA